METDASYVVCDGVASREIEGQVIILRSDDDVLQTLNAAGAFVWRRVLKRQTVGRIVRDLALEFEIERARAAADVDAFVLQLKRQKLIKKIRS